MAHPKEPDAKEPKAKEPNVKEPEPKTDANVIGTSETTTKNTFRTDMGESLPPQKKPGVE